MTSDGAAQLGVASFFYQHGVYEPNSSEALLVHRHHHAIVRPSDSGDDHIETPPCPACRLPLCHKLRPTL